eukprot:COSAG02_NODE_38712_length_425_cov_19.036810_1_plen_49_part_01
MTETVQDDHADNARLKRMFIIRLITLVNNARSRNTSLVYSCHRLSAAYA